MKRKSSPPCHREGLQAELNFVAREFQPKCYDIKYILFQFSERQWTLVPDYQREANVWPKKRQAELIQTVFENLPINQVYLLERKVDEQLEIGLFDGLQRLSTLIAFREDRLGVRKEIIPSNMRLPDIEAEKLSHSQLNSIGQKHFESYQIPIVFIRGLQNKALYFTRLNYSLPPTYGEQLRASNSVRVKQVSILIEEVKPNLILQKNSEWRSQLFHRFCVLIFVAIQGLKILTSANVINEMLIPEAFTSQLLERVRNDILRFPSKIFELHLVALLVAMGENCDRLGDHYKMMCVNDRRRFFALLPGTGRSKSSILLQLEYFNSLCQLDSMTKRQQFLDETPPPKGKEFELMQIVQHSYLSACQRLEVKRRDCELCGNSGENFAFGCTGGPWNRSWEKKVVACVDCNRYLGLFAADECSLQNCPSEQEVAEKDDLVAEKDLVEMPQSCCDECGSRDHLFQKCPRFWPLKVQTSNEDYLVNEADEAKRCDLGGFCAAGLCLVQRRANGSIQKLLLAKETRDGQSKLNFVGGKRERLSETPIETALREFREESAFLSTEQHFMSDVLLTQPLRIKHCLWCATAKYFLFFADLPANGATQIPTGIKWLNEVDSFEWVESTTEEEKWHSFSWEMWAQYRRIESSLNHS